MLKAGVNELPYTTLRSAAVTVTGFWFTTRATVVVAMAKLVLVGEKVTDNVRVPASSRVPDDGV